MRCVLITPFGRPVDPEVKRILAMVSPFTLACASSTAAVTGVARSALKGVEGIDAGADVETTSSQPRGSASVSARSNAAPSAANTRPGSIRAKI